MQRFGHAAPLNTHLLTEGVRTVSRKVVSQAETSKDYSEPAFKIELPAQHNLFSVMLHDNFLQNRNTTDVLKVRHNHARYEVICCWEHDVPAQARFYIIPPGIWHTNRDFPGLTDRSCLCAFQFSVKALPSQMKVENSPCAVLERFLQLDEIVELAPDFDGVYMIEQIRREMRREAAIRYEVLHAGFQLLMIELACALPQYEPGMSADYKYHFNDFRPERIERFFLENYDNPDCCQAQLAKILNISQRQVGRVFEQLYQRSFSRVLTEYRMEFAERWHCEKGLTAAETAALVGYKSVRGFLKAYKNYYNRNYRNKQDMIP